MAKEESEIQREILEFLSWAGIFSWRNYTGGIPHGKFLAQNPAKGAPDILGQTPDGRLLGIEVKTKTGKPTKEQQQFINLINMQGGIGFIARSVEDVVERIGDITGGKITKRCSTFLTD